MLRLSTTQLLLARFQDPKLLGLPDSATLTQLVRQLVADQDSDDESLVYNTALVSLLDLEIATLLRRKESLTIPGQLAYTEGLAVRLIGLRTERRRAMAAAGIVEARSAGVVDSPPSVIVEAVSSL